MNDTLTLLNHTNPHATESQKIDIDFIIGITLGLSAVPGLLGNVAVMVLIVCGKLLSNTKPVIYKMILNLSLSEALQLIGSIVYLAPSIALQYWMVPIEWRIVFGAYFITVHYVNIAMIALIAVNRYIVICKGCVTEFPSQGQANVLMIALWPLAALISGLLAYFSPYKFIYDYQIYSYAYIGCCGTNLRDYIWDIPQNVVVSLIAIFCYSTVTLHIRSLGRHIGEGAGDVQNKSKRKQRRREVRLAIQFSLITFVYTFMWIFFFVYPVVMMPVSPASAVIIDFRVFAALSFLVVANCTFDGLINLCFNEEIKSVIINFCTCKGIHAAWASVSAAAGSGAQREQRRSRNSLMVASVSPMELQ